MPAAATTSRTLRRDCSAVWIIDFESACNIPATATGIAANVTAVNPTAPSFLTVFPADAARPFVSNLNWTATSEPTPNHLSVALSAISTGKLVVFEPDARNEIAWLLVANDK